MMLLFRYITLSIPLSPILIIPQVKMTYASSKDALKRALAGVADEHQANDASELEENEVLQKVSKNTAKAV